VYVIIGFMAGLYRRSGLLGVLIGLPLILAACVVAAVWRLFVRLFGNVIGGSILATVLFLLWLFAPPPPPDVVDAPTTTALVAPVAPVTPVAEIPKGDFSVPAFNASPDDAPLCPQDDSAPAGNVCRDGDGQLHYFSDTK
jgi:hypothetical protein